MQHTGAIDGSAGAHVEVAMEGRIGFAAEVHIGVVAEGYSAVLEHNSVANGCILVDMVAPC